MKKGIIDKSYPKNTKKTVKYEQKTHAKKTLKKERREYIVSRCRLRKNHKNNMIKSHLFIIYGSRLHDPKILNEKRQVTEERLHGIYVHF